jgi:hypothetical protein
MISKEDHCRLRNLLVDAISLLCRNGVPFRSVHRVDALVGITLDKNEVVLININETFHLGNNSDTETVGSVDEGCRSVATRQNTSLHRGKQAIFSYSGQIADKEEKSIPELNKYSTTERMCVASDPTSDRPETCLYLNRTADISCDLHTNTGCEYDMKSTLVAESKISCAAADDIGDQCIFIKTERPCETDSNDQQNFTSGFTNVTANHDLSNAESSVLFNQSQSCHASDWPVQFSLGEKSQRHVGKHQTLPRHLKVTAYLSNYT